MGIQGWRKHSYWKRTAKDLSRNLGKQTRSGGKGKLKRVKKAARDYLNTSRKISEKNKREQGTNSRRCTISKGNSSFDKGFWSKENFEKLNKAVLHLVLPKKGKRNLSESRREVDKKFK